MAPLTTGVIQAILREFSQQRAGRGRYVSGGGSGITATGSVISDYNDGQQFIEHTSLLLLVLLQ